jgi:hypothetical protein
MRRFRSLWPLALLATLALPQGAQAANHREAPITALDRNADITDWYTFVSYDDPDKVTLILAVDPLLEPSNGPTYFPFDPGILYSFHVDNNQDGVAEDVVFEVQFKTEFRPADPRLFTVAVGGLAGIPPITELDGPGSVGLGLRQSYTVHMRRGDDRINLSRGRTLYAVPSNAGPRTMPTYSDPGGLFEQGIYDLGDGIKAFAGTTDDAFYIDLGAAFDSLNFRQAVGGGVLTAAQDADDTTNFAPDDVSGFNVNTIALEVPIALLTRGRAKFPADDRRAVLGTYGSTSRRALTVRRSPQPTSASGAWRQVQRMGNPLINELVIGIGSKDRFSMDDPKNDAQFASFFLNPILGDVFASIGVPVPPAPRTDLLPLVTYAGLPIFPAGTPAGRIADLLRINTGIAPTALASQKRLGVLANDLGGFPNGRRPDDDVTDISARAVAGILTGVNVPIGDGVNKGDTPKRGTFPFVNPSHDGRNSRHVDPNETGCGAGDAGTCPVD